DGCGTGTVTAPEPDPRLHGRVLDLEVHGARILGGRCGVRLRNGQLPRHEPGRPILAKCCLARRRRGRRVAGPPGSWFLRGFGWATGLESLGSQRASVAERDRWGVVC